VSWVDTLLSVGSSLDWVTPGLSLLNGDNGFSVPKEEQNIIKDAMKQAGVRVKYERIFDGMYMFDVDAKDNAKARRVLETT
jgi:hypothetical protein